jgi:hypothetical protein
LASGGTGAKEIVERIDDLFALDHVAREKGHDFAARYRLRGEHAPKLLRMIEEKLETAQS